MVVTATPASPWYNAGAGGPAAAEKINGARLSSLLRPPNPTLERHDKIGILEVSRYYMRVCVFVYLIFCPLFFVLLTSDECADWDCKASFTSHKLYIIFICSWTELNQLGLPSPCVYRYFWLWLTMENWIWTSIFIFYQMIISYEMYNMKRLYTTYKKC